MGFFKILAFSIFSIAFFATASLRPCQAAPISAALAEKLASPQIPQAALVLFDGNSGNYYYLRDGIQKNGLLLESHHLEWTPVTEQALRESIAGPPGLYSFPKGELRVSPDRSILQYRASVLRDWQPVFTGNANYYFYKVGIDAKGSIFARMDGPQANPANLYLLSHKKYPNQLYAMNWKWLGVDPTANLSAIDRTANPYSSGGVIRMENGLIYFAKPKLNFPVQKATDNNSKVSLRMQASLIRALVQTQQHLFVLKGNQLGFLGPNRGFYALNLPPGVSPGPQLQIFSSYDFKKNEPKFGDWGRNSAPEVSKDFFEKLDSYKRTLRERVVDQQRYTDALVDLWRDASLGGSAKDRVKSLLVAGTTGTGKTFGAEEFAELVLGDRRKVLVIDATQYKGGPNTLDHGRLVGFPVGTKDQEKYKGVLPEFLRGPGKDTNVIIINEFDKSSRTFADYIMEMIDSGTLHSGDGTVDSLGRSIIILTSNKGAHKIYPAGRKKPLTRAELDTRLERFNDEDVKELFLEPSPLDQYDTSGILDRSFLARIDRAIAMGPVSYEGALQVAQRKLERAAQGAEGAIGTLLQPDPSIVRHLVDVFYRSPENGIRPVEKAAQKLVGDVAEAIKKNPPEAAAEERKTILRYAPNERAPHLSKIVIESHQGTAAQTLTLPDYPQKDDIRTELSNPETRVKIQNYAQSLGQLVFGQDAAIHMAVRAIRARKLNPNIFKPAALLFLGPTGVGKSELGKAIATEIYGDEHRLASFDMGLIKESYDMAQIFNPPKGVQGSNTMGPFEQFLNDYPTGGVFMFDEIGNMGRDPASREMLLKNFYSILDEGVWVSKSTGKRYTNLRDYAFVFTSNEMQEYLNRLPSDDLRMARWEEANKKDVIHQALVHEYRWPEALVGRFKNNMTLFRPIVASERRRIAKKLVARTLSGLIETHHLGHLEVADDFYQALGDSFFSHAGGGRSIEAMVDGALNDLVGQAVLDSYNDAVPSDAKISLSLTDNYQGQFLYEGDKPYDRHVILTLKLETGASSGAEKIYSVDLAKEAAEVRLFSKSDVQRFVYHEIGHALANDPAFTREEIAHITVKSAGNYLGYARYVSLAPLPTFTRPMVVARLGNLLAGRAAEIFMGLDPSQGAKDDLERARDLANKAVLEGALVADPFRLPTYKSERAVEHPAVQEEAQKLLQEGNAYAERVLKEKKDLFERASAFLLEKGEIDGTQFKELSKAGAPASCSEIISTE